MTSWECSVLDEYVDVWYIHKTKYDYADRVIQNYETDLKAMTDKDYNHPGCCDVFYWK
ncbi:MAG: hypothetical protein ACLTAX_02000 [Waltera sp.]